MTRLVILFLALGTLFTTQAQNAEKVVDQYFEIVGGKKAFADLKQAQFTGTAIQVMGPQQMEFPFNMYQKTGNKQRLDISFQGQTMTQMCFNGKTGWGINFMNMQPEKYTEEQNAMTAADTHFPDALVQYKELGYKLEYDGEEEINGTMCHKIKMTMKPIVVNGEEKENVDYYFFDKETAVLLMLRSYAMEGPMAGQASETHMSDYEEVDGLYFPHTMEIFMNGEKGFQMNMTEIDFKSEIEDSMFEFPGDSEE